LANFKQKEQIVKNTILATFCLSLTIVGCGEAPGQNETQTSDSNTGNSSLARVQTVRSAHSTFNPLNIITSSGETYQLPVCSDPSGTTDQLICQNGSNININGMLTVQTTGTTAIYGISSNSSGYGVWGQNSNGGTGVYGNGTYGTYGDGVNIGAYGGGATYGVYGVENATGGVAYGVFGKANSSDGYGVYGENIAGGFGFYTPNDSYIGGNIFAPNNSFGPEQVVKCTVNVPCRCPPKTFRTGQLEDEAGKTVEMYCQNPFGDRVYR
jgi:hypothetical protein